MNLQQYREFDAEVRKCVADLNALLDRASKSGVGVALETHDVRTVGFSSAHLVSVEIVAPVKSILE